MNASGGRRFVSTKSLEKIFKQSGSAASVSRPCRYSLSREADSDVDVKSDMGMTAVHPAGMEGVK